MMAIQALVGSFLVIVGAVGWWLLVNDCLRMTLVAETVPVLIGGGLTLLVGLGVGWAVHQVDIEIPEPYRALDLGDRHAGAFIGLLERVFFFATIWINQPAGVAAWFGLKVAAKWNAWSHIVKVPGSFPDEALGGLTFRHLWSTRLVSRFLIGTLYNVLCGVAGAAAGWWVVRSLVTGGLVQ